jgi:hypothetical protein
MRRSAILVTGGWPDRITLSSSSVNAVSRRGPRPARLQWFFPQRHGEGIGDVLSRSFCSFCSFCSRSFPLSSLVRSLRSQRSFRSTPQSKSKHRARAKMRGSRKSTENYRRSSVGRSLRARIVQRASKSHRFSICDNTYRPSAMREIVAAGSATGIQFAPHKTAHSPRRASLLCAAVRLSSIPLIRTLEVTAEEPATLSR